MKIEKTCETSKNVSVCANIPLLENTRIVDAIASHLVRAPNSHFSAFQLVFNSWNL